MMKRVLVLGGTGRTGQYVVQYALDIGLEVVALARNPRKLAPREKLSVVEGTPEDLNDVALAIAGCDAVISTLDNRRESDLPWAKPVDAPLFLTHCVGNAIAAMRVAGARRIVVLSALGVGDSFAQAPLITRLFMRYTNLRIVFGDHDAMERVLRGSELDWTCVRAAILTNSPAPKEPIVTFDRAPKPALTVSRASVARFIIDVLDETEFFGKTPIVSERRRTRRSF